MPPPIPRCSSWAYSSLISPSHFSLPRYGRRVGLHIDIFEACSAFTRVAACTLALSPIRDTLIEGFSHFVASMTAPIASGWSESPGGTCTHWKAPPCHGARGNRTFRCQRRCRQIGFGHDSARVLFQGGVQATSLIQINGPACRRSRRSSSLRTEEIAENLSLYMHKFGKYSVILGNIE